MTKGRIAGSEVRFGGSRIGLFNEGVRLAWSARKATTVLPIEVSGRADVQPFGDGWSVMAGKRAVAYVEAPIRISDDGGESRVPVSVQRGGDGLRLRVAGGGAGQVQLTIQGCASPRSEGAGKGGWVSKENGDTPHTTTEFLQVGTKSGATNARTFVKFDTSQWFSQKVLSAQLRMGQDEVASPCATEPLGVRRVTGFPAGWPTDPFPGSFWSPLRWDVQPDVGAELSRTDSWCVQGDVNWDVTQIADNWENGAWPDYGLRVDASNGAGTSKSWRKFWSGNTAKPPVIIVWSSNFRPDLNYPDVQRRWDGSNNELATLTPNVSGWVSDWDGQYVGLRVDICRWVHGDNPPPPYHGIDHPLVGSPEHVPNAGGCKNADWQWVGDWVSPMGEAGWRDVPIPQGVLHDDQWYAFYLRTGDGTSFGRHSATGFNLRTSVGQLGAPEVSASGYPRGQWTETRQKDNYFTFSGGSPIWSFHVYDNGQFVADVPADAQGRARLNYDPPGDGWHEIHVYGIAHSGQVSPVGIYEFGVGPNPVSVSTPTSGQVSSRAFRVNAVGPPQARNALVEWSTDRQSWQSAGQTAVRCEAGFCELSNYVWDMDVSGPAANTRPRPVWMRVRFNMAGGTVVGGERQLTAARNGFFGAAAVEQVGPAEVALSTGDMRIAETDAAVPGYGDVLTVGRVWDEQGRTTRLPGDAGLFGLGWIGDLPGPEDTGAMSATVQDYSDQGFVLLQSPGGYLEAYEQAEDQTGATPGFVLFSPVGDTIASGAQIQKSADRLLVQDADGTVTTFARVGDRWVAQMVQAPGKRVDTAAVSTGDARYSWSGVGVAGVTCASLTLDQALTTEGCRVLKLEVTGGLARSASAIMWDPQQNAMTETRLATYGYDGNRLVSVTDDRTGLTTSYTYVDGHLDTVTPASKNGALLPWHFTYEPAEAGLSRLRSVERERPEGGQAQWRVAYGVPVNDEQKPGLPRLTFDQNAQDQTWVPTLVDPAGPTAPVTAAAVFGPDHRVDGEPAEADWQYAGVTYMDSAGRPVNSAVFGDGQWLVSSTVYKDETSQVTSTLSAANRIKAAAACTDSSTLCLYGTTVATRADMLCTITTYGEGELAPVVVKTRGPWRRHIATGSTTVEGFTQTVTTYDQGAPAVPAGQVPFRLVTSSKQTGEKLAAPGALRTKNPSSRALRRAAKRITALLHHRSTATESFDGRTSAYRYTPDGTTRRGRLLSDTSGWTLRQPTATVVDPGGLNLVTRSLFNADGAVVKQVQPGSSGGDAGTTLLDYYGPGSPAPCTGKPEWNGLVCRSRQADSSPGTGSGTLPVTTTTYTRWVAPKVVTETSGSHTRRTTTTYDAADRPVAVTVTGGAPGDAPVPTVSTRYAPDTGLPTEVSDGARSTHTGYDSWGRMTSYTDGSGATTTTAYDPAGRVAETTNPAGRTSYSYDTATAGITGEHRGVLTGIDYHLPDGLPSQTVTRYGPDGGVDSASGPGGVTYTESRDTAGVTTHAGYALAGGQHVAGWVLATDAHGQTLGQVGSFAGVARGPAAQDLRFGYDHAGRLTTARQSGAECVQRSYVYRADGARTGSRTGGCAGGGSTVGHS